MNRFVEIYANNEWGVGSGEGSLDFQTKGYQKFLQKFLKQKRISSVVDMGCGDWQFSRYINWEGISYIGYDVVPEVIAANIEKYSTNNISFKLYSGDPSELPKSDLLIAKDVLQHLPNQPVLEFLQHLSKYRYALITNCTNPINGDLVNSDIPIGDFRYLDLRLPPFNLDATLIYSFVHREKQIKSKLKTIFRGYPRWKKIVLLVDNNCVD